MALCFKIKQLNIYESYFKGIVDFYGQEYTINIQNERRGKVLKLPFSLNVKKERILVRLSGPENIFVEDYLPYKGESEWMEIDSDQITFFLADHQDQYDMLEVITEIDS
ncbi:MAG: hypothetical protein Q8Q69_03330 [Nitrosopumilaceae archaeon]|nr:hypothetical protein [Nitrosopumilaceae archaeon]